MIKMKIIHLFSCFIVIQNGILLTAQEHRTCPENSILVLNKCVYLGNPSDWFTAMKTCSQMEANITLINTKQDELEVIVAILLNKTITSVWIEAKRNGAFEPITYQLPASNLYGKKLGSHESTFAYTEGMLTKWMINEPALNEENTCMVLKLNNTTNVPEFHAMLNNCSKSIHNFVCITHPCGIQDIRCLDQDVKKKKQNHQNVSRSPKLEIREVNNKYFLDVYTSENPGSSMDSAQNIKSLKCLIEDGNSLISSVCLLDLMRQLSWTSENITALGKIGNEFQYTITKTEYRVLSENEGYLVCRAFITETMDEIVTERHLYRSEPKYHVFAVSLLYSVEVCSPQICDPTYNSEHWWILTKNLTKELTTYREFKTIFIRPIKMTGRAENTVTLVFRIKISSITSAQESVTDLSYLKQLRSKLQSIVSQQNIGPLDIIYIRSSKFCFEEKTYGSTTLHWPVATIGQTVLPLELCVDDEGIPIQRYCTGDFVVGAYWSDESKNSTSTYECKLPSSRTKRLHALTLPDRRNVNATNILKTLEYALTSQDNDTYFTPADIQYTANILANLPYSVLCDFDLPIISNITDAILKISTTSSFMGRSNRKIPQGVTNASNIILESLDHMLNNINLTNSNIYTSKETYSSSALVVTPRFVTLVVDIETNSELNENIRGLAALKTSKHPHIYFRKEDIVLLSHNHSLESLAAMNVSAAVLLPPQFIFNKGGSTCNGHNASTILDCEMNFNSSEFSGVQRNHRLVINLFWDNGLFTATNTNIKMPSHILSVTIDGVKYQDLNPPLILIFDRSQNNHLPFKYKDCVFWDFQANSGYGDWSDTGCSLAVRSDSMESSLKRDICICTHLTHFGQLLSPSAEEEMNVALDMITIVGCSISLLGLLGIALTAIFIPGWSRGASKKIQLHLSASVALLMAVFLLDNFLLSNPEDRAESQFCILLGVLLHFSVVATFCWMLVAAWFQYMRLTKPLASLRRTPHILLKSAVFAWGFPFIPCGTLLIIAPRSYNSSQCYPTGLAHYLSVIAPITIIICINVAMFVLIICSICKSDRSEVHKNRRSLCSNSEKFKQSVAYRRISTLVFLFFLFGLSWIFGIWKLSYLFCSTATLQGLAFFVFFVVLERNTKIKWGCLLTKRECNTAYRYPFSNRNSAMLEMKTNRYSHDYKRTSHNTVSTTSSVC